MWEKQLNITSRRKSPDDVMSLSCNRITVGRAAERRLGLTKFKSLDILLDFGARPIKLAMQLHKDASGEYKLSKLGERKLIEISCGTALRRLRESGIADGRYRYRQDKPSLLVFDLDRPVPRVCCREKKGGTE